MKYRSQIDVFGSILELVTEKGVRLTKLMYLTFTSHKQIKQFLKLLIDNGMLEYDNKQRFYRATKKGLRYLDLYREMELNLSVSSVRIIFFFGKTVGLSPTIDRGIYSLELEDNIIGRVQHLLVTKFLNEQLKKVSTNMHQY